MLWHVKFCHILITNSAIKSKLSASVNFSIPYLLSYADIVSCKKTMSVLKLLGCQNEDCKSHPKDVVIKWVLVTMVAYSRKPGHTLFKPFSNPFQVAVCTHSRAKQAGSVCITDCLKTLKEKWINIAGKTSANHIWCGEKKRKRARAERGWWK